MNLQLISPTRLQSAVSEDNHKLNSTSHFHVSDTKPVIFYREQFLDYDISGFDSRGLKIRLWPSGLWQRVVWQLDAKLRNYMTQNTRILIFQIYSLKREKF